jgi:hypothetical protein
MLREAQAAALRLYTKMYAAGDTTDSGVVSETEESSKLSHVPLVVAAPTGSRATAWFANAV